MVSPFIFVAASIAWYIWSPDGLGEYQSANHESHQAISTQRRPNEMLVGEVKVDKLFQQAQFAVSQELKIDRNLSFYGIQGGWYEYSRRFDNNHVFSGFVEWQDNNNEVFRRSYRVRLFQDHLVYVPVVDLGQLQKFDLSVGEKSQEEDQTPSPENGLGGGKK